MTNTNSAKSIQEVAARFNELAQQEKWFEIQDELFADNVKSIEPPSALYLHNAEGKAAVRRKGEEFVKKIEAFHSGYTSQPIIGGHYFAVARCVEITLQGIGRLKMEQLMVYEVKDGQVITEQFFY